MLPFIIDTSDERCVYLLNSLREKGFDAVERAGTYERCILVLPPAKAVTADDVKALPKGSRIIGGRASAKVSEAMSKKGIAYFSLLENEAFTVKNTIPTAFGCIALMLERSDVCINERKILVLGYGRVAKTLVKYLSGLDCKVYVYTADESERAMAEIFATGTEDSLDAGKYDIVINTVPAPLIGADTPVKEDALIIDLASGNYVEKEGVVKAPSLPAKVAPRSAGTYMEECILDYLRNGGGQ